MPTPKNGELKFLTPDEAVTAIAAYVGNRFQARSLIADALHEGEITAHTDYVGEISDIDPTDVWDDIKVKSTTIGEDVEVDPQIWQASFCWPEEVRYWHWRDGNFLLNASAEPDEIFTGLIFENVQFLRKEIMSLVGRTDRTGSGGRKPDKERWADFWINFLYDCTGDLFDWTRFENKHQLKQAMLGSSPDLFADSNIDFAVNRAWDGLVLRHAKDRLASPRSGVSEE